MTYNEFIQNIIDTRGQWNIPDTEYYESHHIVPSCLGGEPKKYRHKKRDHHPNIIWLYPEEHYIAHKLLALENQDNYKLVLAWEWMAHGITSGRSYFISEEDYGIMRRLFSKLHREIIGDKVRGKKRTPEQKERYRLSKLGDKNPMKNYTGDNHPNANRSCYNNGIENRYYIPGTQPEGWTKGMLYNLTKDRNGENNGAYGKHWYNNGIKNYFGYECPDGYQPGILRKRGDVNE